MASSQIAAPIKPGVYKSKLDGRDYTVTSVEENIPFGSGTDHRVWFAAAHLMEPRGWPQQQFLAEMAQEETTEAA